MSSIRTRAPSASSPVVRRVMRANHGRNTGPEMLLRQTLHRHGLRTCVKSIATRG
jgi:G:T-mismatch repair DNA endonuclease (very short patch repair protein)